MALCTTRLRREYKELQKNPLQNIRTCPKETNILEWHYVIIGQENTLYEGGYYHGTVVFPPEYPYKPPTIRMMTPNGRFKSGARLCLSMSDFHPETWNPMWSVGTILMGLYSFMLDSDITNGSIESSDEDKRQLAKSSLEFNTTNKVYCELFPDLVELFEEERKRRPSDQTEACTTEPSIINDESTKDGAIEKALDSLALDQAIGHESVSGFGNSKSNDSNITPVVESHSLDSLPQPPILTDTPNTAVESVNNAATPPMLPPPESRTVQVSVAKNSPENSAEG